MQSVHLRKYGEATTVDFDLFEVDGVDFRVDAVHASGDTTIMKDEGAEANTTNGFTDEGNGYSIALTATEMQAARVVIYIIDQTATKVWLDKSIVIETYGNASAQHAFDLDTASTAQTGDSFARLGAPAGASIAADLVTIDNFVDDLESRLTAARAGYLDNLNGHTAQTGDSFARLGAPAGASIAADLVVIDNFVDELETRLTALRAGYLDNLNGHTAQTGDSFARLGAPVGASISADLQVVDGNVDDIETSLTGGVNAVQISGSSTAADRLEASVAGLVTGQAQTGTLSTTQMTTNLTEATDDHYNGRIIVWTSGVLLGQATDITDYTGAGGLLTFTAVTEAPSNGDTFVIF